MDSIHWILFENTFDLFLLLLSPFLLLIFWMHEIVFNTVEGSVTNYALSKRHFLAKIFLFWAENENWWSDIYLKLYISFHHNLFDTMSIKIMSINIKKSISKLMPRYSCSRLRMRIDGRTFTSSSVFPFIITFLIQ